MQLITDTATVPQFVLTSGLAATTLLGAKMHPGTLSTPATDSQGVENKALYYKTATANPAAGNSPVSLYITYRIAAL